ncbi:MAG: hypothetical protein OXF04_01975 [bacterium]|nr:hypothetical protein [bacterium]
MLALLAVALFAVTPDAVVTPQSAEAQTRIPPECSPSYDGREGIACARRHPRVAAWPGFVGLTFSATSLQMDEGTEAQVTVTFSRRPEAWWAGHCALRLRVAHGYGQVLDVPGTVVPVSNDDKYFHTQRDHRDEFKEISCNLNGQNQQTITITALETDSPITGEKPPTPELVEKRRDIYCGGEVCGYQRYFDWSWQPHLGDIDARFTLELAQPQYVGGGGDDVGWSPASNTTWRMTSTPTQQIDVKIINNDTSSPDPQQAEEKPPAPLEIILRDSAGNTIDGDHSITLAPGGSDWYSVELSRPPSAAHALQIRSGSSGTDSSAHPVGIGLGAEPPAAWTAGSPYVVNPETQAECEQNNDEGYTNAHTISFIADPAVDIVREHIPKYQWRPESRHPTTDELLREARCVPKGKYTGNRVPAGPLWNTPQKIWVRAWPAGTCNTNTPACWTITNQISGHTRNIHIRIQQPSAHNQPQQQTGQQPADNQQLAEQPPGYTVPAQLIADVRSYAAETSNGDAHVERWNRVLVAFGETVTEFTGTPMAAAEAQTYADRGWTRWNPVVAALAALEAARARQAQNQQADQAQQEEAPQSDQDQQSDEAPQDEVPALEPAYTVPAQLIADVRSYAAETSNGDAHVERWNRVLVAFGETVTEFTGTPMAAAEAQTYADRGWTRWNPVVAALAALESA